MLISLKNLKSCLWFFSYTRMNSKAIFLFLTKVSLWFREFITVFVLCAMMPHQHKEYSNSIRTIEHGALSVNHLWSSLKTEYRVPCAVCSMYSALKGIKKRLSFVSHSQEGRQLFSFSTEWQLNLNLKSNNWRFVFSNRLSHLKALCYVKWHSEHGDQMDRINHDNIINSKLFLLNKDLKTSEVVGFG